MKTMWQNMLVGFTLLSILTACGQTSLPTPLAKKQRPANSPDVYVLGISGKCFKDSQGQDCFDLTSGVREEALQKQSARYNWDYLGAVLPGQTDSTLHDLAFTITKQGNKVVHKGYAGSWSNTYNSSGQRYDGVKTLLTELQAIYNQDIKDVVNPSKIVLVSHSHGVVWSHIVQWALPQVPIEVAVDFDGICTYWVTDNAADINRDGNPYHIPVSNLCGEQTTRGGNASDMQNVIYPNVKFNLDIQASSSLACNKALFVLTGLYDGHDNQRHGGGTQGIHAFNTCEAHDTVIHPNRSGTNAARDMLKIFFPQH